MAAVGIPCGSMTPDERAQCESVDQVGDSQELPEDEASTMRWFREPERCERRGRTDNDVAPSRGQSEVR